MTPTPLSASLRARNVGLQLLSFLVSATFAVGQRKIACPDGEHLEIDIKQISIAYDASRFAGTLSSLSVLAARLDVAPKKLQEAATATQQWDEFLKGLAAGYNSCAITRQQYADGVIRIYPRLQEDGSQLEEIRKVIAAGQKTDAKRLQGLIDDFNEKLRQFAQISGNAIILERIVALSDQLVNSTQESLRQQESDTKNLLQQGKTNTDLILAKLNNLEEMNKQAPLATPAQVGQQVRELRKLLQAKADGAEQAYNEGYALLDQYRFTEAIPYLQTALSDVPLASFYLALGRAYREIPNLKEADKTLRRGLEVSAGDEEYEAALLNLLGSVLQDSGDLDGALQFMQRALKINEKLYGDDDQSVAIDASNIGQILREKGDLDGALRFTLRALRITEARYGFDHPVVAVVSNNVGTILGAKGDLDDALKYMKRALETDEKVYGPEDPKVATYYNNIGTILKRKGDLDGALNYICRALKIDEKVRGPDYPDVARDVSNIGLILQAKGDLNGALEYTQRAMKIDEKAFGIDHPIVGVDANNVGMVLLEQGDLTEALQFTQRALKILQNSYGPNNPSTKTAAFNVERIRRAALR